MSTAHIRERLQARMVGCELRRDPQMKRALENFKAVLDLKVNQQASSAAQLKQIIGIIDRAAMEISARLSLFFTTGCPALGQPAPRRIAPSIAAGQKISSAQE